MNYFAQLNGHNIVMRVIVISEADSPTEAIGIRHCRFVYGSKTQWIQTSYSGSTRGKYAGIGDTWDTQIQEFRERGA